MYYLFNETNIGVSKVIPHGIAGPRNIRVGIISETEIVLSNKSHNMNVFWNYTNNNDIFGEFSSFLYLFLSLHWKEKKNKEMQRIPWNVTHIGLWFVVSSPSLQNISTLAKQKGVSYNTGFRFKYLGVCVFWNQLHIRWIALFKKSRGSLEFYLGMFKNHYYCFNLPNHQGICIAIITKQRKLSNSC